MDTLTHGHTTEQLLHNDHRTEQEEHTTNTPLAHNDYIDFTCPKMMVVSDEGKKLFQKEQDELMIGIIACSQMITEQRRDDATISHRLAPRRHRFRVHQLWQGRSELEAYHKLVRELSLDEEKFKEFFQLNRTQFA